MKIADTQRELQAVLSIIKNAEKGNERISLKLLGDLHKEHFGYAPTQEIFNRIRRLTKNKKAIPTLAALQHDTALSEGARTILVDPPMKALKRESDIDLLMDNLQDYYRLRLVRASQKELAETFAKAKGIQDLDFEEITKGQSDLLQNMRGRGDTKKTLLFAGAKSNSEDLTEEILNDEDDLDTIPMGFDYLDKRTGGFRRGQFLVLAAHKKAGKSILALNMAYNQYRKANLSVCVLPLEMQQKEVRQRLLSKMTAIPFDRFYQKKLTDKDKKRAREAWADFEKHGKDMGCFFSTWKPETQPTVEDIVLQLKPYRYDVIVVDYVNLMRSSDPKQMGSNDWQMLSAFYKQLKEAASILNCLMVGLTQTNSDTGNIKYSSAALEDCDCAIVWKFLDAERAAHQLKAKIEVARHFEPFEFVLTEDYKHMNVASYDSGPALTSDRNAPDTSDFIL